MAFVDAVLDFVGRRIAERLEAPVSGYAPFSSSDPQTLGRILEPADVLFVEGHQKLATAIKYLTQSTCPHASLYAGNLIGKAAGNGEDRLLIEANLGQDVVAVPLSKYRFFNTRICRPVGLTHVEKKQVICFAAARIGRKYDTRHVLRSGTLMAQVRVVKPLSTFDASVGWTAMSRRATMMTRMSAD